MHTRQLPGSDLDLSRMGFGCWAIGGKWWGDDVDDDTSVAAIHAAIDVGVNWFDTAPLYGHGHADAVLRRALGGRIRDVVIATKVGVRWTEGSDHAESCLQPDHLVSDTEASLTRLGVDTIDLLQVHWPCEHGAALPETLDVLEGLRESGKIRWYGLCNYNAAEVAAARDRPGMVSLQTPYSLLRRDLEGPLMDACTAADHSVGVLAYEPLCRGLLTGKFTQLPRFPDTDMRSWDPRFQGARFHHARRLVADLTRAAEKLQVPTAAMAIGWVCAQPGITAAIVGAKRPEQVRDNARFAALMGRAQVWRVVDGIAALHGGWPSEDPA
jgi:aryl-alcohol dehydrogenase-like predicted oxidoreductase